MLAADAVVTLSETMRSVIVARGVPAERVHVIPNGVDVDAFQPRQRNAALAARHGLTDKFVFGYVSNLDHYREGHELLIEAAIRLREQGIPAVALIVGDGSRRTELERLTSRLGADDAVVFTGRVLHSQVLDYYALLDVFVIPRVEELAARLVTPLKPYEAMAAGRPLLVSDLAALKEVVGDDRGRVFPTGDVRALVEVLSDMRAHPAELALMAERARSWVVAERQWSHNASRYKRVYEQVLSGAG
jgi:glycosyltransferase involved in cell wall biosynthesis